MSAPATPTKAPVDELLDRLQVDRLMLDAADELARRPDVLEEARGDPAAFINDFCWAVDFEGRRVYKVTLWPWQERLVRFLGRLADLDGGAYPASAEEPIRLIIDKTRGCGATWTALHFATWLAWAHPPAQVLLQSDIERKAWNLMRRHEWVVRNLPPSFPYPRIAGGARDSLEAKEYANASELHSLSGEPQNVRDYHPSFILVDEHSRFRTRAMDALLGTQADILSVSTANGYGNEFAEVWHDAHDNRGRVWGFRPLFVSWRDRPDLTERPQGKPSVIAQEYPETAEESFITTGEAFFDLLAAREMERVLVAEPARLEDNGDLCVWREPQPRHAYVIGVDVAQGVRKEEGAGDPEDERGGSDFSCAVVRDWDSGEQVAEWHGRIREVRFAHRLVSLARRYSPCLLVVERNPPGNVVVDRLVDLAPHLLYHGPDSRPGFLVDSKTRPMLLGHVDRALLERALPMRSRGFWGEVRTFNVQPTGKAEADAGYHDDRIFATALTQLARMTQSRPGLRTRGRPPDYEQAWDTGMPTPPRVQRHHSSLGI